MPAPPSLRRDLLRRTAQQHDLKTFIETGTWQGGTVAAMLPYVDKIYSIELSETFFNAASERFVGEQKVILYKGDSADCLPQILRLINSPSLFWLDGHYSSGDTALGNKETPIEEEIAAILSAAKQKKHIAESVILIDDARYFGKGNYPPIDKIDAMVRADFPQAAVKVEMDIIRISLIPRTTI